MTQIINALWDIWWCYCWMKEFTTKRWYNRERNKLGDFLKGWFKNILGWLLKTYSRILSQMFVCPKIHMLKPNPQGVNAKKWKFGRCRGFEGGALVNELVPSSKGCREWACEDAAGRRWVWSRKTALITNQPWWLLVWTS